MFKKFTTFTLRYKIGKGFIRLGAWIVGGPESTLVIHDALPSESPFNNLSTILCSDTEDEIKARAAVRERIGDDKLARAFAFYMKDFPKGTITDFNQLDATTRRWYFEKSLPKSGVQPFEGEIVTTIEDGQYVIRWLADSVVIKEVKTPLRDALTPIRACDVPDEQ